jgi:probable F420-dependent oxidoreductase
MASAPAAPWSERLRATGVWKFTEAMSAGEADEFAARIEALGYSALWLPDTLGRDPFAHIAHLARATSTLAFATGIASISHRHPGPMQQAANTVAEQSDGRFVLGLGVSHEPFVTGLRKLDYSRPLTRMRAYLDAMDEAPYTAVPPAEPPPRLLAALGPKMLELARDAADGAHPYNTTPEHTEAARRILGPDKLLCVEQKVLLSTDASTARDVARKWIGFSTSLPNYRRNWIRLGFSDDDIDQLSDRFVDGLVAWGNAETILRRVQAHHDAGATHVCIQPLPAGADPVDWECLEALAPRR